MHLLTSPAGMLPAKFKRDIVKIVPYGIVWFVFSIIYLILEKGLLGNLGYYPATGNPYRVTSSILIIPGAAFITGLVIGAMEVLYIHTRFLHVSFGKKIVYKSAIYLTITSLFIILVSAIASYRAMNGGFFDRESWKYVWSFVFTYTFLSIVLYIGSIIVIAQFYAELKDFVGPSALRSFFTGKYHHPVEEERIFMFLDMQSSTRIAEGLGHTAFFGLLKAYYADLSKSIIEHYGEVYQYAGDEIIVSWTMKNGLHENNVIRCFYSMKSVLKSNETAYLSRFKLMPAFKAGFHLGKVTAGEIGAIKKEIVFTGDVLNTTARIQGLCNQYQVDNILSKDLVRLLNLSDYTVRSLGENELKGKHDKLILFTTQPR